MARPRVVCAQSTEDLKREIAAIGSDFEGLEKMVPAGEFRAIKLHALPGETARTLKAIMLGLGGEVAIASDVYFGSQGSTDALLMGTLATFARLGDALRNTSDDLAHIAEAVDRTLRAFGGGRGTTTCRDVVFEWGSRTYVMGIINVTPDSFSLDGLGYDVEAAVEQASRFVAEGADILDVGGESTRPGHKPVPLDEELRRVLPVVEALAREFSVPISIDTYKAEVARRAVAAGATMVNDVWGLRADPDMAEAVAAAGVPVVLMHNQDDTEYRNLMDDLIDSLGESVDRALRAGVKWENIIVDPGIGFGKTWQHNLEVLARLAELKSLGRPILLGTSRKSTIGRVLDLPVQDRLEGTAATVALGIAHGADIVRVHDVKEMVRVSRMADAMVRRRWPESSSG